MSVTRKVVAQARTVAEEVRRGIKKAADWQGQEVVDLLARELKDVSALTSRVLEQTKARVIQGNCFAAQQFHCQKSYLPRGSR